MPMNPEWLPVLGLILAGLFTGALALRALYSRNGQHAVQLGVGAVGLIALAIALGSPRITPDKIWPLTPASEAPATISADDPDTASISIVLGAVVLRVPASNRYDLALDGKRFLALETSRKGLLVSCDAGSPKDDFAFHVRSNRFVYPSWPAGKQNRPDEHTFAVQNGGGADVFRVRYADRHRIEVMGVFFTEGSRDTMEIRDHGGIRWPGGGAPPNTMMDLRHFGKGTIEFEKSGLVRMKR